MRAKTEIAKKARGKCRATKAKHKNNKKNVDMTVLSMENVKLKVIGKL